MRKTFAILLMTMGTASLGWSQASSTTQTTPAAKTGTAAKPSDSGEACRVNQADGHY